MNGRISAMVKNSRNVLCIFPRYAPSFGTFEHAYKLFPNVDAFMPPQGLLTVAAYLPSTWNVKFIDENSRIASDEEIRWADAILMSGMHVQRGFIEEANARAHRHGKLTILGGPSVSACPEYYPGVDVLHVGEMGDATDKVIAYIDAHTDRPASQVVFETNKRIELDDFPKPAYEQINIGNYFLGSIQYSSGCPYLCEFCDIPALYGRQPRLKRPERICEELDGIVEAGLNGAVYFVDDNFIGNKKAARELMPHLIRWQQENQYPLRFACEATLNIAKSNELLSMMREAQFHTVFVGIETPEEEALLAMRKKQNLSTPLIESVQTLNSYGMEVVSGIIMGLDTDTARTGQAIQRFVEASQIPLLTINVLYALPKTPLYDRLQKEGRLLSGEAANGRVSNVEFRLPYDEVVQMWHETVTTAYRPDNLFGRFRYQTENTFPNRIDVTPKLSFALIKYGMSVFTRVLWHCGMTSQWRKNFWDLCWPLMRQGRIEEVIHIGVVTHHLLTFTAEIEAGNWEACF
ncbi:MAG: B12-binding domain-containing radical SAM protein, partial [Chromatiales bacterium]|nr:B12-binding domain-containing radical SAM protein [Chromatiales bacterium]